MIYFDNAATTFKKPNTVIRSVNEALKRYCANAGRSSHKLALITAEKIYEARERIAGFLGISSPERVIFTQNATYALNLAIKTSLCEGTHVLISDIEHNAVFRPIYAESQRRNIDYSIFATKGDIEKNIKALLRDNTRYIVSSICSNVTGREISLEKLSNISKSYGLKLIIDASQLIGHKNINLMKTPCDILCAPGHKALFGIQGAAFAIFLDENERETFIQGGSGSYSARPDMPDVLPERFEAGTLPAPSIISLSAGIEFINNVGIDNIEKRLSVLSHKVAERIDAISTSVLYEYDNGVISFNISSIPAETVSAELDKYGICVRSGLHCAPLAHKTIGTEKIGTVRVSLSYFNNEREIDKLYYALRSVEKKYL